MVAGVSCVGAIAAYIVVVVYPELPNVASLAEYRPTEPMRIYSANGELLAEYGIEKRIPLKYEEIPARLRNALLATEDVHFFEHEGVDFPGLARATFVNVMHGGKAQGASTITMQLARNFFLTRQKTYARKLYEILLAIKIEKALTKPQILTLYMNQVYLGERAYGFAAAARVYYEKAVGDLTLDECAMLAGLPKAPAALNPIVNPAGARERQLAVLARMQSAGVVTHEEYALAVKAPAFMPPERSRPNVPASSVNETVRRLMVSAFGDDAYESGLHVWTTIDPEKQRAAAQSVADGVKAYERRHPRWPGVQAALVAVAPEDGAILAMVGDNGVSGQHFNRVTQISRQPGSAFKPFLYAAALADGYGPTTAVYDVPVVIRPAPDAPIWRPKPDGRELGEIPLGTALTRSRNFVAIRLAQAVGPQRAKDYIVRNFGFREAMIPANLPMALGAGAVSPLEMAVGYSVFANGGYRVSPYLIAKVVDSSGAVQYEAKPQRARVIDESVSYLMSGMLRQVAQRGTASATRVLKRNDLAGKTGTTNDYRDGWFGGFQNTIAAVAWMGFDSPRSLGPGEWGSKTALPMWIDFMGRVLTDVPEADLVPPQSIVEIDGVPYARGSTPGHGFVEKLSEDGDVVRREDASPEHPPEAASHADAAERTPVSRPPETASQERQRILQYFLQP
ncbi:penicillin-binding protein 1A [Pandoraea aquatica]|nr:PBP1A family penicillin-binding protein [Pandoraea aquatica]